MSLNPLDMTEELYESAKASFGEELLQKCQYRYFNPMSPGKFAGPGLGGPPRIGCEPPSGGYERETAGASGGENNGVAGSFHERSPYESRSRDSHHHYQGHGNYGHSNYYNSNNSYNQGSHYNREYR